MNLPTQKRYWALIFCGFLLVPILINSVIQLIMFWLFPKLAEDWFTAAGQFGDQFGVITCAAAMFAGYFTYQTLKSQREQSAKHDKDARQAEAERHFFKLYDDFREALLEERKWDSEPQGRGTTGTKWVFAEVMGRMMNLSMLPWFPREAGSSKPGKIAFCSTLGEWNEMGKYKYLEMALKFSVSFQYLEKLRKEMGEEAVSLYYETLITSLHEDEVKVICIFLVEMSTLKNRKWDMDLSTRIMNVWSNHILGIDLTDNEVMAALCIKASIMRDVALEMTIGDPQGVKTQPVVNLFRMLPPKPVLPPSGQGSAKGSSDQPQPTKTE